MSYASLVEGGHITAELFWLFLGVCLSPSPLFETSEKFRFGLFWVCLAPFGSISGLFRVHFGELGGSGVGSGRGASEREKTITDLDKSSDRSSNTASIAAASTQGLPRQTSDLCET